MVCDFEVFEKVCCECNLFVLQFRFVGLSDIYLRGLRVTSVRKENELFHKKVLIHTEF